MNEVVGEAIGEESGKCSVGTRTRMLNASRQGRPLDFGAALVSWLVDNLVLQITITRKRRQV